ncbi:uncharacterized protein METZ01_LOCUS515708, partial [marine metagenome]
VGVHRTSIGPSDLDIGFERIAFKSHPSFLPVLIISHTLGAQYLFKSPDVVTKHAIQLLIT